MTILDSTERSAGPGTIASPIAAHMPGIDALRALAIVAVVGSHVLPAGLHGGFLGVDLFFLISGFLITLSSFRNGTTKFSIWQFWSRRISRIIPALLVVSVFIALVAKWMPLSVGENWTMSRTMMGQAFFVQNFDFSRVGGDYFAGLREAKFNLHLWSIAVEEQFYMVFPVVALVLLQLKRPAVPAVATLVLLAVISLSWPVSGDGVGAYYLTIHRVWQLALGCLLALAVLAGFRLRVDGTAGLLLEGVAIATVFLLLAVSGPANALSLATLVPLALAGSVIILMATSGTSRIAGRLGAWPVVAAVGVASYSIYLWHWPIYAFLKYAFFDFGQRWQDAAIYLGILVPVASVSYWLLELKLRPLATRFAIIPFLIFVPTVYLLGVKAYDRNAQPGPVELSGLVSKGCGALPCLHGEGENTIILYGDSHAEALWSLMEEIADDRGNRLVGVFPCSAGRKDGSCASSYEAVRAEVEKGTVVAVLAVSRWSSAATGYPSWEPEKSGPVFYAHNGLVADNQVEMGAIWKASIADLEHDLKDVPLFFLRQVPQFPYFPTKELMLAERGVPVRGLFPKPLMEHRADHAFVNDHLDAIGAQVIDPADVLCAEGLCHSTEEGLSLYHDDDHISVNGAALLRPLIEDALTLSEAGRDEGTSPETTTPSTP